MIGGSGGVEKKVGTTTVEWRRVEPGARNPATVVGVVAVGCGGGGGGCWGGGRGGGRELSVRSWDESANTEEGEERRENTRTLRRNKGIQVCED